MNSKRGIAIWFRWPPACFAWVAGRHLSQRRRPTRRHVNPSCRFTLV